MAAVTGTAVTAIALSKNTAKDTSVSAMTAATNSGTLVTDTETFDFPITKNDGSFLIQINNGCGATVTCSVLKGAMFASTAALADFTIATGKTYSLMLESAMFKSAAGKISIKVTPTAGTALNASSKVNVSILNLPA